MVGARLQDGYSGTGMESPFPITRIGGRGLSSAPLGSFSVLITLTVTDGTLLSSVVELRLSATRPMRPDP